jgi:hypothetical protein
MADREQGVRPAVITSVSATKDVALEEMAPVIETIQAFAREIEQMSEEALVRNDQHIEKLRKAHRIEEAAAIQADFLKQSMDHAVQQMRKYIEMLATFPHELVWPVNAAVEMAHGARHATAAKVEALSKVAGKG